MGTPKHIFPGFPADLAFYHAGLPEQPIVVLLHGVTDSAASLADAISYFRQQFYVIACDLRGHGQSGRFTKAMLEHPVQVMAEDLTQVLQALRARGQKIVVYGHSMGGAVACEVLYQRPGLADRLILEDPAWLNETQRLHYRNDAPHLVKRIQAMRRQPLQAMQTLADNYPHWSWTEISAWYQAKCLVDLNFIATGQVCCATPYPTYIRQLQLPTLLLSGVDDALLDADKCQEIRTFNNHFIRHIISESGGHCLRRDRPAFFSHCLEQWQPLHTLSPQSGESACTG